MKSSTDWPSAPPEQPRPGSDTQTCPNEGVAFRPLAADACLVRRRDQDWATSADGFTIVSTTPRRIRDLTLLVIVVAGLATWGFMHFTHLTASVPSFRPTVVYGTGHTKISGSSLPMTCTAMQGRTCVTWTLVSVGQHAVKAAPLPAGTRCLSATADQSTGRWVCTVSP